MNFDQLEQEALAAADEPVVMTDEDHARNTLTRQAAKARFRRFDVNPITGFGDLDE